jgi:L-threonylcarbamoyladenylate synthase
MPIEDGRDPAALERAAQRLAQGQLVAFATETVYGLGARADDDAAVARIFEAKGRPSDHPLIVHVAEAAAASHFAEPVSRAAQALMQALWPGPVSIVLRRRAGQATAAAGGLATVALRCPSHPVAQALLRRAAALGVPGVAAPSANRFGRVSPTRAAHVQDEFGLELLVLDGGPCEAGIESAIVDASGDVPRLLRPGSQPREAIERALGQRLGDPLAQSPRVSGSLASHYAPTAAVYLVRAAELEAAVQQQVRQHGAAAVGVFARERPAGLAPVAFAAMPDNAVGAAHLLFDTLRQFDAAGLRAICVEAPPEDPDWDGVRDRLQRAAAPR